MTISDYYKNYSKNKKFPKQLPNGGDITIDAFYQNCIKGNINLKKNVLDWHNMFMEYVDMDDAILWVRYYESGPLINGRYSNRRACYTEFADGFKYVFVSNYDAHEIFNMICQGVTPDVNEFKKMMSNFEYPLHYDNGDSKRCEEADICAYPNIGSVWSGVLTRNCWYLAHIYGIKEAFLRSNGTMKKIGTKEKARIYPRGLQNDWHIDPTKGVMTRKLNYNLLQEEKDLVKAHFLRFVDPLNYFIVPGESYENHDRAKYSGSRIGEYKALTEYVGWQFEKEYEVKNIKDFRKKALISMPINVSISKIAKDKISITYGTKSPVPKQSIIKTANKSNKNSNTSVMSIIKMLAAEGITSSSKDEIVLLMSARSKRQLASDIIERLYNNQAVFFNSIIKKSSKPSEYDFGVVNDAFAEYPVASTKLNKGRSRYLMNKAYNVNGVDLYLSGDWYAMSQAKPTVHANWPSINDLIRVLNQCFDANFVYIESEKNCQIWGPSGTL